MNDEEGMCCDCPNGDLSLFSNSYIFVNYFIHHDKLGIFTTGSVQILQHVTNIRCVPLSVGDEPCSPVLDHFKLIDLAFIVGVPGRTSIL